MAKFNINDVGDNMLKEKLQQKALELGMPADELIDKYITDGLDESEFSDSKYSSNLSDEERKIRLQDALNDDIERGIVNTQGNFETLIELVKLRNG